MASTIADNEVGTESRRKKPTRNWIIYYFRTFSRKEKAKEVKKGKMTQIVQTRNLYYICIHNIKCSTMYLHAIADCWNWIAGKDSYSFISSANNLNFSLIISVTECIFSYELWGKSVKYYFYIIVLRNSFSLITLLSLLYYATTVLCLGSRAIFIACI